MTSHINFKISQLRQQSVIRSIESISVFAAALFVSSFLPTLLVQYVYGTQALLSTPKVLEYIAPASFGFAMLYFLFALIGNIVREGKVRRLEMDLNDMNCDCHDEEKEIKQLASAMVKSAKPVAKKRKPTSKKK